MEAPTAWEGKHAPANHPGSRGGAKSNQSTQGHHDARRHFEIVSELARKGKARGTLRMDAHVAALAIEHGATLCSSDRDFARFPCLRLEDPTTT